MMFIIDYFFTIVLVKSIGVWKDKEVLQGHDGHTSVWRYIRRETHVK